MKTVSVGAGQGFYGDTPRGAIDVALHGDVEYICCDALAELTVAILQKERMRDPGSGGFTRDIAAFAKALLPVCRERGIRLITNGGGMNPLAGAAAVAAVARDLGMDDLRIGVVTGDDMSGRLDELVAAGQRLNNNDTGAPFSEIRDTTLLAVAYLGMSPVRRALEEGAEVVITGRVADAALFLAPLAHEFGWADDAWDLLASGVVAGHLLECSAQSTGGNFSGDWRAVPDMAHIGYPICRMNEDGTGVITKPQGSGGIVSVASVAQQLLYEVGNPAAYLSPDVIADFTSVQLEDMGDNTVAFSGIRGAAKPQTLKMVAAHSRGYMGTASLTYSWPDALDKARHAAAVIDTWVDDAGLDPEETWVEYQGVNALHAHAAPVPAADDINEVTLRYAARFRDERSAAAVGRLATPLALNGPPFIGGGAVPSSPRLLLGTWPALVERSLIEPGVSVSVQTARAL